MLHDQKVLDLHYYWTASAIEEARQFLKKMVEKGTLKEECYIITGRGVHSKDGKPKIKPALALLLRNGMIKYQLINRGGCFKIKVNDLRKGCI